MSTITPLPTSSLYTACDPEQFSFNTTAELEEVTEIIGQTRATEAVKFGIGIQREGYNLYVMGPPGMGKHTMVKHYLEKQAKGRPVPPDWCYINNFDQPHKPQILRLPPGKGRELSQDMTHLIEELSVALPAAFESDEYRNRVQELEDRLKEQQEHAFNELAEKSAARNIKLFRTPSGFAFAPLSGEEVIGPDEFDKLPQKERERIEEVVANLQEELQKILQQIPLWRKETREKLKQLNREVTFSAVGHLIDSLRDKYRDIDEVMQYFDALAHDIVENVKDFTKGEDGGIEISGLGLTQKPTEPTALHRYKVNILVDNSETSGAPVVYLDNPTYVNLVGRLEHFAQFGALVTDFTLLKPGALHQANGGYLILDVRKLLMQPYAWEGLKRTLFSSEVRIEPLEKVLGLLSTTSLEPEAIPLDIKVVLLGDRMLYYLLHEYDPEFAELFKVQADFEHEIERSDKNQQLYAKVLATLAQKEQLRALDRGAVARVIEYASRHIEDTERLTTHMHSIANLLREADYWAGENSHDVLTASDIQKAIDQQVYRACRVHEKVREAVLREIVLIDTSGERVGQVNGLSVIAMGEYAFGQPSRITATVHIGEGNVVDIEREVELGGAIHSKGVMILSAFLAAKYARKQPLSLSASLVFEQSYGMVDGDSASLAELCALLSALAEAPIKQSLAMTGSVNQNGQVQAIGGVNEKVEGYFDVCNERGLTGAQGVLIPASNVKHLMLKQEVVDAVESGRFAVYAVSSVDEAMQLLTGVEMGAIDSEGNYPEQSVNGRALARLKEMAEIRHAFGEHAKDEQHCTAEDEAQKKDDA